jgi:hypothetical protein
LRRSSLSSFAVGADAKRTECQAKAKHLESDEFSVS